jgi:hypothetical protein
MQIALNTTAHRHEGVDDRMIYCALLPLLFWPKAAAGSSPA